MELYRIIRELLQERDRLQRIIDSLEQVEPSSKAQVRTDGKRRGRKSMDRAAREQVSERMKRYWAQRKADKNPRGVDQNPRGKDQSGDTEG